MNPMRVSAIKSILLVAAATLICGAGMVDKVPEEILDILPSSVDIHAPKNFDSKRELLEHIRNCGLGVVEGVKLSPDHPDRNRCPYSIRLDEEFFTPLSERTGLLKDREWPYRDGENWFIPSEKVMAEVPENFDLRELMTVGQPSIKKQQCGDCWAWASHHGIEIARAIHDKKVTDHAVQTVLSCSGHGSCGGGYMSTPTWLVGRGLPYEEQHPYVGRDTPCPWSSQQQAQGWDGKLIGAPNVGQSLRYSRALRLPNGEFREGTKVKEIMAAIWQARAPAVVTVSAYSVGAGVYTTCSNINSGGNHMVDIVGWEMWQGKRVAHVWNSWGLSHGENGVSRIVWECGDNRLNRGLGVSARIIKYKPACQAAEAYIGKNEYEIRVGGSVSLGRKQSGVRCRWLPGVGLSEPHSCQTEAKPQQSTEYHLEVENECGVSSAMTLVRVLRSEPNSKRDWILTPHGKITRRHARQNVR